MGKFRTGCAALLIAAGISMAGCGGGGSNDAATNGTSPPSGSIQGVATPSSVSVVTATNAQ